MSRRRKVNRKNRTVAAVFGAAYRCSHCRSDVEIVGDRVTVYHDNSCPVLSGLLPSTPDTLRAIEAVEREDEAARHATT